MCTRHRNNVLSELDTAQMTDGSSNSSSSSSSTAQTEKKTDGSRANISCSATQSKSAGAPKGGSTATGGKFMLQFPPGNQYIPKRVPNPGNMGTEWVLQNTEEQVKKLLNCLIFLYVSSFQEHTSSEDIQVDKVCLLMLSLYLKK